MNRTPSLVRTLILAACLGAGTASANGQNVTALSGSSITTYSQQSDYFIKDQHVPSNAFKLPAPVLEESRKGYVKVRLEDKDVWLDPMDITLHPPKSSGATGCVPLKYNSSAGVGRGAGEGC